MPDHEQKELKGLHSWKGLDAQSMVRAGLALSQAGLAVAAHGADHRQAQSSQRCCPWGHRRRAVLPGGRGEVRIVCPVGKVTVISSVGRGPDRSPLVGPGFTLMSGSEGYMQSGCGEGSSPEHQRLC